MRFIIERNSLKNALAHVAGIVERRNTIPILSNILISAGSNLTLKATDLDIEVIETVNAEVETPGATTVSAQMLKDITSKLPDGSKIKFDLDAKAGRVKVQSGRSKFELHVLPADDFPALGSGELPFSFELAAKELKRLFGKAQFAMSTEETRYYLNGIYFHAVDGSKLRTVATDGHRLARVDTDLPEAVRAVAHTMPGVIVPRKTIAEVTKLLSGQETVQIELSDAKIRFRLGAFELTSKLINGSFPDYARVIPTSNKKVVTLATDALSKAVDRVSTLKPDRSGAIKLSFGQDELVISANSPEQGSAQEDVPAEYRGAPIEIGFNSKYVLDIAEQIDGPKMQLALNDASSPTLISDADDPSAIYVLMPMRV